MNKNSGEILIFICIWLQVGVPKPYMKVSFRQVCRISKINKRILPIITHIGNLVREITMFEMGWKTPLIKKPGSYEEITGEFSDYPNKAWRL